jgi:hypothetical protein
MPIAGRMARIPRLKGLLKKAPASHPVSSARSLSFTVAGQGNAKVRIERVADPNCQIYCRSGQILIWSVPGHLPE